MQANRDLLDQLMGVDRNLSADERPTRKTCWSDEGVCKLFICGFCPHDLFSNTKSDLGMCEEIHDVNLRKKFQKEHHNVKRPYENRFLGYLESLIDNLDRRKARASDRIHPSGPPGADKAAEDAERAKAQKLKDLTDNIEQLLKQMEELGEVGKVNESQNLLKLVEQLQKEKHAILSADLANQVMSPTQEKRMRICEVCGAFLVVNDAESRVLSHLEGKQHMGYQKIRDTIEKMTGGTDVDKDGDDDENRSEERKRLMSQSPPRRRNESHNINSRDRSRSPLRGSNRYKDSRERERDDRDHRRHAQRDRHYY